MANLNSRLVKVEAAIGQVASGGAPMVAWELNGKYCITTATLKDGYQSMLYPLAGNAADFTLTKAEVDAAAARQGRAVMLIEVVEEEGGAWPAR